MIENIEELLKNLTESQRLHVLALNEETKKEGISLVDRMLPWHWLQTYYMQNIQSQIEKENE